MNKYRAIALVATYNEERFIESCLDNLIAQGFVVYLLDNGSTDRTRRIAGRHIGRGLLAIEDVPRADGAYDLAAILERKEGLARSLGADWFMHSDADEIRLPPTGYRTIVEALDEVEADGANAVNFQEFTFLPTREEPDHDHPAFAKTMRHYYPFSPHPLHHVKLWRRHPLGVRLADSGGHVADFPGRVVWPTAFRFKHYPVLSRAHALEKYGGRRYLPCNVARGFHGWRPKLSRLAARLDLCELELPRAAELRKTQGDDDLDISSPLLNHRWMESWTQQGGWHRWLSWNRLRTLASGRPARGHN